MVYISPDANTFFLSREAMVQLGIISTGFPRIGEALSIDSNCQAITTIDTVDNSIPNDSLQSVVAQNTLCHQANQPNFPLHAFLRTKTG